MAVEFLEVTDIENQTYYINVHQIQAVTVTKLQGEVDEEPRLEATLTLSRVTVDVCGKEAKKVLDYVKKDCLNLEQTE